MLSAGARDPRCDGERNQRVYGIHSLCMSDTPAYHPTPPPPSPLPEMLIKAGDWVSTFWAVGSLPTAFVLVCITALWLQGPETHACPEGIEGLQEMGRRGGFGRVQMEGVFSLQWDPSFSFCQWVPATYTSGLHPGEAVKLAAGPPIVEPSSCLLCPRKCTRIPAGTLPGAPSPRCGPPLPHPHPN